MTRRFSFKHNLFASAATVVVLAGAALAAVTATGAGTGHVGAKAPRSAARVARNLLTPAAAYLGVSIAQLESELATGESLAEVAGSTPGKSASGLVDTIVAERKQKLVAAEGSLTTRVTAAVERKGGAAGVRGALRKLRAHEPGWWRLFASPTRLGYVAANYLGIPATQLQGDLKSGRTLAQIAAATPGRSEAGLIEALVTARRAKLAALLASGRLHAAKASRIAATLNKRMKRFANASPTRRP